MRSLTAVSILVMCLLCSGCRSNQTVDTQSLLDNPKELPAYMYAIAPEPGETVSLDTFIHYYEPQFLADPILTNLCLIIDESAMGEDFRVHSGNLTLFAGGSIYTTLDATSEFDILSRSEPERILLDICWGWEPEVGLHHLKTIIEDGNTIYEYQWAIEVVP